MGFLRQTDVAACLQFKRGRTESTTQKEINLGIVNIVVGIAPANPAEFVVVQIQRIAAQIQAYGVVFWGRVTIRLTHIAAGTTTGGGSPVASDWLPGPRDLATLA